MQVHHAGSPLPQSYLLFLGIWAGEHPAGADEAETWRRLRGFRREGIDVFLDLTEAGERPPYAQLLRPGARHVRVPMPAEELPSPEGVREAIVAADRALGNGRFVYVHGAEGIERTGIVVGCWLAHWGHHFGDPVASLDDFRRGLRGPRRASPESAAGQAFVRSWKSRSVPRGSGAKGGLRVLPAVQRATEGGSL